jgi:hypothetical protein
MSTEHDVIDGLLERIRSDHLAWVNGDSSGYEFQDETSTVLGAFGGAGVGASTATAGQRRVVTMFESGSGSVELLNSGASGDVVWLVLIERAMVKFKGNADPSRWDLRVTEVFERRNSEWVRVHRHADPLVDHHSSANFSVCCPDSPNLRPLMEHG